MYVERVLSINSGWPILIEKKEKEWKEASNTLQKIDDNVLTSTLKRLKESESPINYLEYLNMHLNSYSSSRMHVSGWNEDLETESNAVISALGNEPSKNGVVASILGMDEISGGDFTTNAYLGIPYYFALGTLEVAVLFVPTEVAIDYFIKFGFTGPIPKNFPTEKLCRSQLTRFTALNNKAPIVLAFISPTFFEEIEVEEITPLKFGEHTIERTLEFAPEYYQASVGLLSHFGKILRDKDPQTKAKVRIEQDGNIVRLHIESAPGNIETIEERLEQYALIVNKQAPPESLLDNPGQIIELKAQLRVAQMQVETAYELKQLSDGRITSLEKQVEFLQSQFAAQILQTDKVIDIVGRQNDSHERMQAALLTHSGTLFKDLLQESSGNQRLTEAVTSLQHNLLSGMAIIDIEDKLEQSLATIKETKPGFLGRIQKDLEGAAYKAAASSTITWVAKWLGAHAQ